MATKRVPSLLLTRISTAILPALCAASSPALTSAGFDHRLAADLEDDVALLDALLGGRPVGSTPSTTTPSSPAPDREAARAEAEPRQAVVGSSRGCRLGLLLARQGARA